MLCKILQNHLIYLNQFVHGGSVDLAGAVGLDGPGAGHRRRRLDPVPPHPRRRHSGHAGPGRTGHRPLVHPPVSTHRSGDRRPVPDTRRRAHLHRVLGLCRLLIRPDISCRNSPSSILRAEIRPANSAPTAAITRSNAARCSPIRRSRWSNSVSNELS